MQTTPGRSHPLSDRASLDLDLLRYLSILKSRWLLVGFIMLGSVGLAALMAFTRPSTYEADAKLLVEIDRTSSLTGFGEGVGQLDPLVNAQNPLSTELQIITSRPVLQRVVETLNLKNASGEPLEPKDIQERLGAQILGGADVIQISFAHSDPEIAAVIVNTLADVYISNNIDDNTAKSGKALQLVEARLPESEAFVSKAEAELRNFKESNGIVSLPEEAAATVTTLEALESQSLATAVELREAQVRSQQLQSSLGLTLQQASTVSELSQSPGIQGALLEIQNLERQRSAELGFYTAEGPTVRYYQAQIDSLNGLLQREVASTLGRDQSIQRRFLQAGEAKQTLIASFVQAETDRLSLASRLNSLEYALGTYKGRGETIPMLEQKQAELERKLEVARASYQTLLQRLQELEAAESQAVGNVRLIDPAIIPQTPGFDNKLILIAGAVVGAFLSTSAVAILEILGSRKPAVKNTYASALDASQIKDSQLALMTETTPIEKNNYRIN